MFVACSNDNCEAQPLAYAWPFHVALRCECECGASYCDVNCQIDEWARHKETCDQIHKQSPILMLVNKIWWAARVRGGVAI